MSISGGAVRAICNLWDILPVQACTGWMAAVNVGWNISVGRSRRSATRFSDGIASVEVELTSMESRLLAVLSKASRLVVILKVALRQLASFVCRAVSAPVKWAANPITFPRSRSEKVLKDGEEDCEREWDSSAQAAVASVGGGRRRRRGRGGRCTGGRRGGRVGSGRARPSLTHNEVASMMTPIGATEGRESGGAGSGERFQVLCSLAEVGGKTIAVEVSGKQSVARLKAQVEEREGLPCSAVRVTLGGKELEDEARLAASGVRRWRVQDARRDSACAG